MLRHQGHRVLEAADGAAGLAVARAGHPDLVITDILMPVMDGYELFKQLRLDPATQAIPVVFYTAHYGQREAREFALSSGVADVLTKPARSAEVLRVVSRVLSPTPETPVEDDAFPMTAAFDREHLRIVTDALTEKAIDLKATNIRLRALINIGLELASEQDPGRLLETVCAAAHDLFSATYVTLGIVDLDDRTVRHFVTSGTDAASWVKAGDAISGVLETVVTERRAFRYDSPGDAPAGTAFPPPHPEVQAFLAVPVASPAHVYGWFCLVGNEGRGFTSEDEQLVTALSAQIGRVYENRRSRAIAQARIDELEQAVIELSGPANALSSASPSG